MVSGATGGYSPVSSRALSRGLESTPQVRPFMAELHSPLFAWIGGAVYIAGWW
jgi:hypothetical protein